MKIVVFDEWLPWPLESGKKIRTYNLLVRLARNHKIIFVAYAKLPEEQEKFNLFSKIFYRVVIVEDKRKERWSFSFYFDVLKNIFSNKPFSSAYHINNEFADQLVKTILEEKPDLLHCEWTNYAPFLNYTSKLPYVIASHNVESDIWRRLRYNTKNIFVKFIAMQQAKRIEILERYWYPKAACTIAVSQQDKSVIEKYGARVIVVENGVDINYYHSFIDNNTDCDSNSIIFTASFDTFSNQDGAYFLIEQIYPLLKKEMPTIKLLLVGKNPPKRLIKYGATDTNIIVTGTVQDVRPYLSKTSVSVIPLRIGGGSRLKILESMAIGKPVISTTIGAEGLSVQNGLNILIEDNPSEFAKKVKCLLNDDHLRKKIVDEALILVEDKYNWDILAHGQHLAWISAITHQ